jgi:hypothetical protein
MVAADAGDNVTARAPAATVQTAAVKAKERSLMG